MSLDPQLSYPKEKIKILLLEGIHTSAKQTFKKAGYSDITILPKALNEADLVQEISGVHILGIRSKTNITQKVIDAADRLIGVGCFCIGTNQVDLNAATLAGIPVFNSPYSNTRSVAELVIAESIMLIRKIPLRDKAAHKGEWLKDAVGSYELRGKTLGIMGYGHIGSQVSVLAEAMGLNVLYYDIEPKLPLGNAQPVGSLEELLQTADIVTLHVPATAETKNLLSADKIALLKDAGYFLNLSRGNVVDLEALAERIKQGTTAGAGLDVYPKEPKAKGERFTSPLQELDNVILTPHIGGSTVEAQVNIGIDVGHKLSYLLDTGSTVGSNSVPTLSLPRQKGTHRILHTHANQPGILTAINKSLSDLNVNVVGQYLKTNDLVGYVVLDVDESASREALQELKKIDGTIKTRILY